ncbi:putative beta-glucosidase C, partial [Colletotrichum shisoi]
MEAIDDRRNTAEWYNNLRRHATEAGLSIPITIPVDPQHGVTTQTALSFAAKAFSRWPDPMGAAALRSPELARKYAKVVRETYPGDKFDLDLIPSKAAIAAGTAQIMSYCFRPIGTHWEEFAFGFNKSIVTNLLKEQLGFESIVVTDWNNVKQRFWGLEEASEKERTRRGVITEERIDYSARKLMKEKCELGLFDNPYTDVEASVKTVNNSYFARLCRELQRQGIPEDVMESYGLAIVGTPQETAYALLQLRSLYKPTSIFGPLGEINKFHRPPAVPEIVEQASALLLNYSSTPDALLDVDGWAPEGKLPIEVPRSQAAADAQLEDVPFDSVDLLF